MFHVDPVLVAAVSTTRQQQAINARVLLRDQYRCMLALPGEWVTKQGQKRRCAGRADCVHHTKGRKVTGWDMAYMVAACTPCNLRIGEPDRTADPPHRTMTEW